MLIVGACWCLIDKPFVNPYKDNSNLVACSRIEHVKRCQEIIEDGGCYKKQQYKVGTVHVLICVFGCFRRHQKESYFAKDYYCNKLDLGVSYLWTKPHRCFDCIDDYNCFGSEFKSKKTLDLSSAQLSCNLVAAMAPVIWINLDQFDTNQPMKWGSERRWTVGPKNWMIHPPSGLEDNSFL